MNIPSVFRLRLLSYCGKVSVMRKNSAFDMEKFSRDDMHAIDAKFEAQKIAFAPLAFQAVRALLETGIMRIIDESGEKGISALDISKKSGISEYGVNVLTEMAVGMHVLLLKTVVN